MSFKAPKDFSVDEVGLFLVAVGLGDLAPQFRSAAVDGGLLTDLGEDDLKEVGCSGLQAKKILHSLGFAKQLAAGGGGGGTGAATEERVRQLEAENAQLRAEIQRLTAPPQPTKAAAPPPASHPPPPQKMGHPVLAGAARGTARGAVLGAVAGAVAGDPAKGAKMGAAVGATSGGMGGLAARRRARMAGYY